MLLICLGNNLDQRLSKEIERFTLNIELIICNLMVCYQLIYSFNGFVTFTPKAAQALNPLS